MSQDNVQGMKSSGQTHKLSIALVIGATIGVIGLVILLYGLFGAPDISRSDGINIDLWWGLVMVIFGLLMAGISYLSSRGQTAQHRSSMNAGSEQDSRANLAEKRR